MPVVDALFDPLDAPLDAPPDAPLDAPPDAPPQPIVITADAANGTIVFSKYRLTIASSITSLVSHFMYTIAAYLTI